MPEPRSHTSSTYSIVARDPETGELAVGVESRYFAVGSVVPWVRAGVGAVATQHSHNPAFGVRALDLLESGHSPEEALAKILADDTKPESRQLAMVDANGRVVVHTGQDCGEWAGSRVGEDYSAQGNTLAGERVVAAMAEAFESSAGPLAHRVLCALEAAQAAGGDKRGQQAAAVVVAKPEALSGGYECAVNLRVDDHPRPVDELRRLYGIWQRCYVKRQDAPPAAIEGPRPARACELDDTVDLVDLVFCGQVGAQPSMRDHFPLLFCEANLDDLAIMLKDGKPITHLGICQNDISVYGCRSRAGSLGAVCTHPDHRGHGYATKTLHYVMSKLNEDGADILLISGGRGLYRRNQCVNAGLSWTYEIPSEALHPLADDSVETRPLGDDHIPRVAALHQQEPVRFVRTPEMFQTLLRGRQNVGIWRGDELVGYLTFRMAETNDEPKRQICGIADFAGSRSAIVAALPLVVRAHEADGVSFATYWSDAALKQILADSGIAARLSDCRGHSVRVLNLPRLMERFRSYIAERVGAEAAAALTFEQIGERFWVRHGREELEIDEPGKLTTLVLGTPEGDEKALIPSTGELGRILPHIFPLPFILPGINYT